MELTNNTLCRLCAKDAVHSKDLLDKNNHNILQLVQDLMHVTVIKNDGFPSKVCETCEEKILSFQYFVEECSKVQEHFKSLPISVVQDETNEYIPAVPVKFEVKEEYAVEGEIADELDLNTESFSDIHTAEFEYDNDLLEDITIASLKRIKGKSKKDLDTKKTTKKMNGKIRAFFRMSCEICNEPMKNWSGLESHYTIMHSDLKPVQHCVCGYASYSQSALYKHYTEHKVDNEEKKQNRVKLIELLNFNCTMCGVKRKNWSSLESHYKRQHRAQPEVKCVCGFIIRSRSMMYKHSHAHNNESELFSCELCPKISKTKSALLRHMEIKHGAPPEKEMKCANCDKVFTNKELLKSHVKSHIPVEERKCHKCPCCSLKFTTRSSMLSHKKVVHDQIKSYICDQCGYACGTNGELKQHRAIHSDEKPFVCSKCSKRFKTYSNLKTHMDTHEDTSYACYVCGRILNSRRTLRKHLLVHQSECRHVCSYCNKAFKRRQTLKVHLSTHTGDKPMSCKWCDEKFAYASTLRSHRLRFHPDKVAANPAPAHPYITAAAATVIEFTNSYETNLKSPGESQTVEGSWKVDL